jgi:transaldolase
MHPIHRLRELGQSVWLDHMDRALVLSGELDRMIEVDGLAGLTSNPTIYQKAIARTDDYDALVRDAPASESAADVFERIQTRDLTLVCDRFRGLYEATNCADGFVSIEVSPLLARDTDASIQAARRLWTAVSRANLLVKIPGTREGLPAIHECLAQGININVTLLFSVPRYCEVADAYFRALERRVRAGEPIDGIASVASFFVSRVDTKVDVLLERLGERGAELRGQIAIANAKVAYEEYERLYSSERWRRLAAMGARPQRLLWGSTSPKNPAYPDLYYVEELIGPETVDTMPLATFRAYVDHGYPDRRLRAERHLAHQELAGLAALGIDLCRANTELEDEGVHAFISSYCAAEGAIAEKRRAFRKSA